MIVSALLLVFLSVVLPPVECNGISRRSFVESIPATMATDFGDNPSAQISYQAFGIITETTASSSSASPKRAKTVKRKCEGVLLSPKPKKEPTAYPFLSWYTGSESGDDRYGIREDSSDVGREIHLSSWLAHKSAAYSTDMTSINTALQGCRFSKRVGLIALKCEQLDVCKGKTVLSGSAFFTFSTTGRKKIVSIAGLVSLRSSGTFCRDVPSNGVSTDETPKTPQCRHAYVCGTRLTDKNVIAILSEARKLDGKLQNHANVIPSGTISTWNVQYAGTGEVLPRVRTRASRNVAKHFGSGRDIVALQEVGSQLHYTSSREFAFFRDNILRFLPGRELKAVGSGAFVFNSEKFSIVDCGVSCVSEGAVNCSFKNKETSKKFTIYNVHLTNGYANARYRELKKIQENSTHLKGCDDAVMIVGDFNIGAGKTRNGGRTVDAFIDTKVTMKILHNMQFPDPGPTTFRETASAGRARRESHFDRFAVSKNVRLMYTYFPERFQIASKTAGTRNNAPPDPSPTDPPGTRAPPTTRFWPKRISKKVSSCPPEFHDYRIQNQNDRMKYFDRELLACHPEKRRKYKPNFRSRDLSDHLPVMFTHTTHTGASSTKYTIATWNMKSFDPTIDPHSVADREAFEDRKEIKYTSQFSKILRKFNIVAAQELKPNSINDNIGQVLNVKNTTKTIFEKQWYWSATTPELGFAVGDDIVANNCKDIDMKGIVSEKARPSFMCDFYKESGNKFLLTLINAHVRNDDSTTEKAEMYRKEAEKNVAQEKKDAAFLVGDFNTILRSTKKCTMPSLAGVSFTKYDKFARLDYVWPVTQASEPGIAGCRVYNPEILHVPVEDIFSTSFLFPDVNPPTRMKAFAVWNSVSDHYPVYMKFFVP